MTPAELADELKMLSRNATPGAWSWTDDNGVAFPRQWRLSPGVLLADGLSGTPGGDSIDRANGALIVALRNNLPAILSSLRRVEKLEAALRPFAAIAPSAVYVSDGSDGETYCVTMGDGRYPPFDFTGEDLFRARALTGAACRDEQNPSQDEAP